MTTTTTIRRRENRRNSPKNNLGRSASRMERGENGAGRERVKGGRIAGERMSEGESYVSGEEGKAKESFIVSK